MGWWKVKETQHVVSDMPIEALGAAVAAVLAEYQVAWKRRPTKEEWEALLTATLGAEEPEARALDDGVVSMVKLDTVRGSE